MAMHLKRVGGRFVAAMAVLLAVAVTRLSLKNTDLPLQGG
jgi:hypothetical protein